MLGLYTSIPVDSEFCNTSFHGDHLEYPDGFRIKSYEEDIPMKTDAKFASTDNWQRFRWKKMKWDEWTKSDDNGS